MGKHGIGIDIGGTKTAVALVSAQGQIVDKITMATEPTRGFADFLTRLHNLYQQLLTRLGVSSFPIIGVAAPGPLNLAQGLMYDSPNLHWGEIPLVSQLEKTFKAPIILQNDATAAAYAEYRFGAGKGSQCMVYITISTGIGGGAVIAGRLFTGSIGNGAEFGHIPLVPNGPVCGCGQAGCWEACASGTAIARKAEKLLGRKASAREVGAAFFAGEGWAQELLVETANCSGQAVAIIAQNFDPDCLVFGGGVAVGLGTAYLELIKKRAMAASANLRLAEPKFTLAGLKGDSALVGAAALTLA